MNRDRIDVSDTVSIFPMDYLSENQWFTKYLLVDSEKNNYEWFYNPIALIIKLAKMGLLERK